MLYLQGSQELHKIKPEAYTPKLISIGPFHHGGNEFKDMEKHKVRYFKDFLKRTRKSMDDLLEIIKVDKEKISHCYSEDCIVQSVDHFMKMILLDAIFIIELFLKVKDSKIKLKKKKKKKEEDEEEEVKRKRKKRGRKEEDYILRKPWLLNGTAYDLMLLENQIPYFILEKLYMLALNDSPSCNHGEEGTQTVTQDAPFVMLSHNFFACTL
jgi:small nuclear ribonucleoprotein (snRNP)-like protein